MSLYNKIIDLQKLTAAWTKVRKNKPAAGVDGITCEQFDEMKKAELKQLNEELRDHIYRTLPVKNVVLYKGEKARKIALYSMRDKVVQQSVASELSKIYEPLFPNCAYAYRNGRSALNAVDLISEMMKMGKYSYLMKLDIASFFDRIQWPVLKKLLMKKISEEDVINLIRQDVQAFHLEEGGELIEKHTGVHQGSGISPVISNIYLMDFDSWMMSKDVFYIRYSDDILVLGESREQLISLLTEIKSRLMEYGLAINEKKQVMTDTGEGTDYLGYHLSASGKAIPAKAEQSLLERLELMWLTTSETDCESKIKKAAEIIGGWEQYFKEDRENISIFEYVTLAGLAGADQARIDHLAATRENIDNIYKDIMEYLSEFWRDQNRPSLELLEYEQYFRIWKKRKTERTDKELQEILLLYRRYMIRPEETDIMTELMQLYTDFREYDKASFWQEKKEKEARYKNGNQKNIISPAHDKSSEFVWDKGTVSRYLKLLAGREDIYALETIDTGQHRKNELQAIPLTEKVITRHLRGECTVATFVQRPNATVRNMVIDIDISKKILVQFGSDSPEFKEYLQKAGTTAQKMVSFLHNLGIQGYIEYSGYRGYHIWVFFSEWLPVRYINMLQDYIESRTDTEADSGISFEFFPNKTRLKPGKFGQAIKLPYGFHSKTGDTSYFIDEDGERVVDINPYLDAVSKTTLTTIKRILASNTGYKEAKAIKTIDENLDAYKDASATSIEILKKCNLMRYLCQKAVKTGYLTHFERLSILYVFGHLGQEGQEFVHKVMSFTLNYNYNTTERFIRRCPEKPISCVKLRDQYKKVTAEFGCSCVFKRTKNCYPSPVMHAISSSNDIQPDITLPTSRTITAEKKQKVLDEINIHKKAMELAKKILAYKKQKRSIDSNIIKVEKELSTIYDDAGVDVLEIEMGLLVRRKKGEGYEWLIEL